MGRTTRSNKQCPPCPNRNPTPWLVFRHEPKSKPNAVEKQTFCTVTPSPPHNKFYLKSVPELRGKYAFGCSHGWLLLIDDNDGLSLWNPVSFKALSLPPLHEEVVEAYIETSVLTCPPEDEGSLVLLFTRNLVAFCHPGDDAWVVQAPRIEGSDEVLMFGDVVVCNGVLYGWVYSRSPRDHLVMIEINSDGSNPRLSFRFIGPLKFQKYYVPSSLMMTCMTECCGEVYQILLHLDRASEKRVLRVVVWRLDLGQMAWVEVKSLKGHVFFYCEHYSVSCHGAIPESDSGGLYFVLPEDKTLYFYRVEDASVTYVLPCPNLKKPWLDPFWVLPCYPRSLVPKQIEEHNVVKGTGKANKLDNLEDRQAHEWADVHHAENEPKAIILSKLPKCMISLIAEHLLSSDYLNFRSACKDFRAAAPPLRSRTTTSALLMLLNNYKDYIEENDNGDQFLWDVIDPIWFDTHYPMSVPKLFEGAVITFSSKGWLLARKGNDSLRFLNPFTRMSGKYPHHHRMSSVSAIGFSTTPASPGCLTVGISVRNGISISYIRCGDEAWNQLEFPPHEKGFLFPSSSTSLVYHDGVFYFLDSEGYLGAFELKGEEGSWRVFDKRVPVRSSSFHSRHIVECNGQIVVVVVGFMGKWVSAFSWNPQAEGWNKVKSLGDQTIFVSPYSCFSSAARSDKGNRIYFPRLYGKHVVFYSMATRKWHLVGSNEPLSDFHGTKEFLQCSWIEPDWSG